MTQSAVGPTTPHSISSKGRRFSLRRAGLIVLFLLLYLVSTVPVGLALYSLKSAEGIDLFKAGGFHTYLKCVDTSFRQERAVR